MPERQQSDENRLVDIEVKLAYQERTVGELSEALFEQRKQVDQLQNTCKQLANRLNELAELLREGQPPVEKPPHY